MKKTLKKLNYDDCTTKFNGYHQVVVQLYVTSLTEPGNQQEYNNLKIH